MLKPNPIVMAKADAILRFKLTGDDDYLIIARDADLDARDIKRRRSLGQSTEEILSTYFFYKLTAEQVEEISSWEDGAPVPRPI